MGLTPVLCDVDPHTGNIDPDAAAALVGPRTSAILGVHLWGRPCDVAALAAIAERHGLTLLLDAAQAFGARHLGRPVGGFGAAEVFSFHATKLVNTFEGGAVVTDDGALASRVRAMHNFGIVGEDEVALPGTNGKMSEAAAAMGLVSLEALPAVLARNRRRHLRYRSALAGIDGVALQEPDPDSAPSHHYAVVRIDPDRFGLSRDQLMAVLRAENVVARRYFYPGCHRMAPYSAPDRSFPHADALSASLLALPTGASVDGADIDRIAAIIAVAGAHSRTVSAAAAHPRPASALSTVAPDGEPAESGQPRGDGA
jgi:dTDP-4-amino-4,6-dideoxyglucose